MAVEELGGREDHRAHDGPGRGGRVRGGEETKEEAASRLPVR